MKIILEFNSHSEMQEFCKQTIKDVNVKQPTIDSLADNISKAVWNEFQEQLCDEYPTLYMRIINCFKWRSIKSMDDLLSLSQYQVKSMPNLGLNSFNAIKKTLQKNNLSLGNKPNPNFDQIMGFRK